MQLLFNKLGGLHIGQHVIHVLEGVIAPCRNAFPCNTKLVQESLHMAVIHLDSAKLCNTVMHNINDLQHVFVEHIEGNKIGILMNI